MANSALRPVVPAEMNPQLAPVLVHDAASLSQLESYLKRVSSAGHDVETNVVPTFFHRKLRTLQFGDRNEQYVVDLLKFAGSPESLAAQQGHYGRNIGSLEPVVSVVKPFLEDHDKEKIGHSLQFEYEVERWCLGIRPTGFFDLLVAEKLLKAGLVHLMMEGFWGLDDIVGRYLGLELEKSLQKSFDLHSELTEGQVIYGALDVRLPFAIAPGQKKLLEKEGLSWTAQVEHDAISAFGEMYLNGFPISKTKWQERIYKDEARLKTVIAKLDSFFLPIVGSKYSTAEEKEELKCLERAWSDCRKRTPEGRAERAEKRILYMELKKRETKRRRLASDCEGEALINYGSGAQLKNGLFELGVAKKDLPNTEDETLEKLSSLSEIRVKRVFDEDPELSRLNVIDLVRMHRTINKALTTYGYTWITDYNHVYEGIPAPGHIDPDTGRIHSRIFQIGADTGRTSSTRPNVQNLPQDDDYRSCFTPVEEFDGLEGDVITIDYSGCELRILAELSQDPIWLEAFRNDWDLHSIIGELVYGDEWKNAAEPGCAYYAFKKKCKCKIHKELRDKRIKVVNFSIAYGKTAYGLAKDMDVTKREAEVILNRWKKVNKVVNAYLDKAGASSVANLMARTLSGRIRYWQKPTWERAAKLAEEDLKKGEVLTDDLIRRKYKSLFGSIERQGKNSSIQGTNADIIKRSMYYIWLDGEKYGIKQVNTVHDENVLLAPKARSEEATAFAVECMKKAGAEFVKSLVMDCEPHIASCWSKD